MMGTGQLRWSGLGSMRSGCAAGRSRLTARSGMKRRQAEQIAHRGPESSLVEISGARLRLGSHDITKPVPAGATEASFRLRLLAGPANLQAHFVSGRDEGRWAHAAYYVGVQRLDEPL